VGRTSRVVWGGVTKLALILGAAASVVTIWLFAIPGKHEDVKSNFYARVESLTRRPNNQSSWALVLENHGKKIIHVYQICSLFLVGDTVDVVRRSIDVAEEQCEKAPVVDYEIKPWTNARAVLAAQNRDPFTAPFSAVVTRVAYEESIDGEKFYWGYHFCVSFSNRLRDTECFMTESDDGIPMPVGPKKNYFANVPEG